MKIDSLREINRSLIAELEQFVGFLFFFLLVGHQGLEVLLDQILPELHFHSGKVVDLTGAEIPVFDPVWVDYYRLGKSFIVFAGIVFSNIQYLPKSSLCTLS